MLWLSLAALLSASPRAQVARADALGFDHGHQLWTSLLQQYVSNGTVDYRGLAVDGQPRLATYLAGLGTASRLESRWDTHQRLAFWINAYNAYTVRLILDHYPLPSIRSIGWLPLAAFRMKIAPLGPAGAPVSLNTIENDILRARFSEPRLHFAIVCASKSCPALRSESYQPDRLDAQLDEAARGFFMDRTKNRWDPETRTLYLSSIFKWFRADFARDGQTLQTFAARYLPPADGTSLIEGPVRIVFLDYDWALNGQ